MGKGYSNLNYTFKLNINKLLSTLIALKLIKIVLNLT